MVDWASGPQTKLGVNPADAGSISGNVSFPLMQGLPILGTIALLGASFKLGITGVPDGLECVNYVKTRLQSKIAA